MLEENIYEKDQNNPNKYNINDQSSIIPHT